MKRKGITAIATAESMVVGQKPMTPNSWAVTRAVWNSIETKILRTPDPLHFWTWAIQEGPIIVEETIV